MAGQKTTGGKDHERKRKERDEGPGINRDLPEKGA